MRRRTKRENVGVALFPFLAVLICTMGALIVLLVMNVQQASVEAKSIAAEQAKANEPNPADLKKQQEALEEARWRQEVLEQQRKERQDALQETRLALSHLEDHIRRLNIRGKELMELLDKVKAGKKTKEEDLAAARQELTKIKDDLAKKKDELAKKKKESTSAEKWYALIPYDGPNGTRRMPIYIECVAEGVVIQPEGVLLTADDFRGEPSPGNPLDAALRTKREYIMKATGGKAAEPYPLLVVRPSGVLSYGAARACMKFWEDEWGYELISEDKNLDFGPRDPNLDQIMSQEVAQARKRQAVMAMAMPRKYTREEVPRSFAPEDNPEVQRRRETVAGGGVGSGGTGNGVGGGKGGRGGNGLGNGNGGVGGTGPRGAGTGGLPGAEGSGTGPYGSGSDLVASHDPGGTPGAGGTGSGTGGSGGTGPGGGTAASSKAGSPRLTQPNQGGTSAPGTGNFAGGTPGGTSASGGTSPSGSGNTNNSSQANAASGGSATGGGASGGTSGSASGGAPSVASAVGSPSGSPGGQAMPNIGLNMGATDKAPPAGSQKAGKGSGGPSRTAKAKNWGLPEAQRHISGVTRPIGITMQKDKLILLPERADQRRPQEISLSPEMTPREVESLVSGVQRQMKSWGIALDGGYWKPALSVDVQPGAEDRFAELKSVLQGSGIEVQRKIR
ncbi:MAG: hypothetical protein ACKVP0_18760 [Pirellulaceae bacterium]